MRSSIQLLVVLSSILLLPAGCGGGGGGDGPAAPTTDLFAGTYATTQFIGKIGPPLTASAHWGTMISDGMGSITGGTNTSVTNGVLGPTLPITGGPYTMLPANRMQFTFGAAVIAEGGVSSDGQLANLGVVAPGAGASIVLLARRGGGYSPAHLNGTYHYAQFLASATGANDVSFWGSATFDGIGGVAYSLWSNTDGTVSGPVALAGTYAVAADGALQITIGTTVYLGGIIRGGDVGIFSGTSSATGVAGMGVFVKYSTAASDATFNGSYHLALLTADSALLPPTNWRAATGTLDADGAGSFLFTSLMQSDDHGVVTPIPGPFMSAPYSVVANGGMTVASSLVGAVSSDGRVVAFVGGVPAASGPALWLMIR